MGHVGVGWVMQGWGGSSRGGVGHALWVMQGWSGVGHAEVRWIKHYGSCRGGVGHSGVNGENNRCYSHLSPNAE